MMPRRRVGKDAEQERQNERERASERASEGERESGERDFMPTGAPGRGPVTDVASPYVGRGNILIA